MLIDLVGIIVHNSIQGCQCLYVCKWNIAMHKVSYSFNKCSDEDDLPPALAAAVAASPPPSSASPASQQTTSQMSEGQFSSCTKVNTDNQKDGQPHTHPLEGGTVNGIICWWQYCAGRFSFPSANTVDTYAWVFLEITSPQSKPVYRVWISQGPIDSLSHVEA